MVAWKLWAGLPRVKLWEAVALLLEIDPRSLEPTAHSWMSAGPGREADPSFAPRSFPSKETRRAFDEALEFAERAASYSGPIHILSTPFVGMSKRNAEVALSDVVAFFVSCDGPDIPAPLLALVAPAGSASADNAADPVAAAVPSIAPAGKATSPPPLTTPEIAEAFDGIYGLTARQWREKLGDANNHQWVVPARAEKGTAPKASTWWPITLAKLLLERDASDESLNRAFLTAPKLKPWLPLWQEWRRERNAFGQ